MAQARLNCCRWAPRAARTTWRAVVALPPLLAQVMTVTLRAMRQAQLQPHHAPQRQQQLLPLLKQSARLRLPEVQA